VSGSSRVTPPKLRRSQKNSSNPAVQREPEHPRLASDAGAITFQFCTSYCWATITRFLRAGGLLSREVRFHIAAESIARDLLDAHLHALKMRPVCGVDFGDQPPQTIPRTGELLR
jgi:hypothetical protein